MSETDNVKLTIVVPRHLRDAARRKAKAVDLSVSQYIRRCLRAWVADEPVPEPEAQENKKTF